MSKYKCLIYVRHSNQGLYAKRESAGDRERANKCHDLQ